MPDFRPSEIVLTQFHADAITLARMEEERTDRHPPQWLSEIECVVKLIVSVQLRLVERRKLESLRDLLDTGVAIPTDDAERAVRMIESWLVSPTTTGDV